MAEMTSSTSNGSNLCLLLLGKTGHGKSASGNSILGAKHFKSSSNLDSVTTCAEMASGKVDGRHVLVVDTPGLVDTRLDADASATVAMDAFNSGVTLCPDGFHALVLVFRYGMRMTDEERMAIEKLKEMLGEDIIREYTVLLFTHGDNFDPEEVRMTFNEWIKSQEGYLGDLIKECDNRFVLFNNKAKDEEEKSRQRQDLLNCVDKMQWRGRRYTKVLFDQAKETWNKLIRQRKDAEVSSKVNAAVGAISTELLAAQAKSGKIDNVYFDSLRGKLGALYSLITDMGQPEKGNVESQIKAMDEHILTVKRKQEEEEKKQAELERLRAEAEALERQQREEMERQQAEIRKAEEEMKRKMEEMERERLEREARIRAEMSHHKKKKRKWYKF